MKRLSDKKFIDLILYSNWIGEETKEYTWMWRLQVALTEKVK